MTKEDFFNKKIDFSQIKENLTELRNEHVVNLATSLPNILSDFPEQKKLIMLMDIVGFSTNSTKEQVSKIYLFQRYIAAQFINNTLTPFKKIKITASIPTGDGCYIIADVCEEKTALDFLIELIHGLKNIHISEEELFSLRISALNGSCVPIRDISNHKNYIGDGMNEASRILGGGQSALEKDWLKNNPDKDEKDAKLYSRNSIFLDDSLCSQIQDYKEKCSGIYKFDEVSDKHGKKRNVTVLQGIL